MFYIKLALKNFENNRLRLWLNVISVIAGVVLLTLILTLSSNFKSVLYNEMKVSDERILTIAVGNNVNTLNYLFLPVFDDTTIGTVTSNEHIVKAEGLLGASVTRIYSGSSTEEKKIFLTTTLYGAREGFLELYDTRIAQGNYPSNNGEIAIGAAIAEAYSLTIGDHIFVEQGSTTTTFVITGITKELQEQAFSTTPTMMNNILLINQSSEVFAHSSYICVAAMVDDVSSIRKASDSLAEILNDNCTDSFPSNAKIVVVSRLDVLSMIDGWFVLVNIFIALLFVIVSLIVVLNLSNMMIMTILQRRKEIAVLKVIGGTNSQVSRFYMVECLIIGGIGTLIGLVVSVIAAYSVGAILSWPMSIELTHLLFVILVSLGSPFVAGLLSQRRISALDPKAVFNE